MREQPRQSYVNVLQNTRVSLQQKYQQIPQLSVGGEYDLNQLVAVCSKKFKIERKCIANTEFSSKLKGVILGDAT